MVDDRLRAAWESGQELRLSPGLIGLPPGEPSAEHGGRPPKELTPIEAADLLELLSTEGGHPRGLRIQGALITGECDWSWHEFKAPLILRSCVVEQHIYLRYARLPQLELINCRAQAIKLDKATITHDCLLDGSRIAALAADGVQLAGDLLLRQGFQVRGLIGLDGASIGGTLDASDAVLLRPGHVALSADGARIGGDLFLCDDFRAEGEIRLLGANIGGNLEANGATLTAPMADALAADGARVGGDVQLCEGFSAEGQVRFVNASIGGYLDLDSAVITNPGGTTLNARRVRVAGSITLNDGFAANGQIRLYGASIGGNLEANGAVLNSPGDHALNAEGAQIAGSVFLRNGFSATGEVRFRSATVGRGLDLRRAELSNPGGTALSLEGARILGALRMQHLSPPPDGSVNLTRATVGELRDAPESWPAPGRLILAGLTYDRLGTGAPLDAATRLDWLDRTRTFSPQPYQQLATVLASSGHTDQARRVRIAARDDARVRGGLRPHQKLTNWFLSKTISHGYRPARPAWLLATLFVLTWVFVQLSAGAGLFVPTGDNVPQDPNTGKVMISSAHCTADYPCLIPGAYALENIIPVLDLHQASLWQPVTDGGRGTALRIWLYGTAIVGWVGTSLIVVALTGLADRRRE